MNTRYLLTLGLSFIALRAAAQDDSPYAKFGYEGRILKTPQERQQYMLVVSNTDTTATVASIGIEPQKGKYYFFDKNLNLISADTITATQTARFLSADPLTKKYPELTPFQFASNTPIRAIDQDGLEGVVLGGADLSNQGKVSQTMTDIQQGVQNNLTNKGINTPVKSFNVSRNDALTPNILNTDAYKNALNFIVKNYDPQKPLVIYGYSYGGAVATALQHDLIPLGIQIDRLILVDANQGFFGKDYVPFITPAVKETFDFYQTETNLVGSRGFPATTFSPNQNSSVHNYDKTNITPNQPGQIPTSAPVNLQRTNKHSNIDETTFNQSVLLMTQGLIR